MLKQEVLGEKLMKGVQAGTVHCLKEGHGCYCTGEGSNFTSSSDSWLLHIENS